MRRLRAERRYERVDITGLTGVTEAQRRALLALGGVERVGHDIPPAEACSSNPERSRSCRRE